MKCSDKHWNKIFPKMIHLFAGGESSLEKLNEDLDGLKVVINFGYAHCEKFDILIYLDDVVGYHLAKYYTEKPDFKIVCAVQNGHMIKSWIDKEISYPFGAFTLTHAIQYLKGRYPHSKIIIYGLDGGNKHYYDSTIKQNVDDTEMLKRFNRCYAEFEKMPCGKENIFNGNPNSPCKAFEFATN